MTKKQCQNIHIKNRFKQRLGIDLTKKLKKEIIHNIQNNKYPCVAKQSLRVSFFKANFNGKVVHLLYDKLRHSLITVLFPEQYEVPREVRSFKGSSKN